MLSTGFMAAFGFVFWLLVAHLYHPSQVGVASTLISSMNFIAAASLLGFNSTFLRFLPKSQNRNDQINTGLILVACTAMLTAGAFVLLAASFSTKLGFLRQNPFYWIGFIILAVGASVNLVTDSIFLAYRSARYNLLVDGIIGSGTQVLLPILLVGLGAYGIYVAQGGAAFIAMIVSIVLLAAKFKYRPKLSIDRKTLRELGRFSLGNQLANLLGIFPTVMLPIIVLTRLGPAKAGYYYLAFTMANLLFTVAYAISQSSFAEGSHEEGPVKAVMLRAARISAAIMIPASLLFAFVGPRILYLFGTSYGAYGSETIIVLAISGPFVNAFILGSVTLEIMKKIGTRIAANAIFAFTICCLAFYWAPRGLPWIAAAWLIGQATSAAFIFFVLAVSSGRKRHSPINSEAVSRTQSSLSQPA